MAAKGAVGAPTLKNAPLSEMSIALRYAPGLDFNANHALALQAKVKKRLPSVSVRAPLQAPIVVGDETPPSTISIQPGRD